MPDKTIEESTKRPYPLKGIETKIASTVAFLVMAGVLLSFYFESWAVLEKIGCLIVIVGIAITWRDVANKIERAREITQKRIKQSEVDERTMNFENVFNILRKRALAFEAVTLMLGTFLWGFGSVIGDYLWCFDV